MTDRRLAWCLFALALITYVWFFGGGGWNGDAQFDLTGALVERGTLPIDGYSNNTGDISPGRRADTLPLLQWDDLLRGKIAVVWGAGNIGERIFGAKTRSSVMPVAVWLLAGSGLLLVWAGRLGESPPSGYTSAPHNPCPRR